MTTHPAFILAAGFGTRLRPLTNFRPKPLVPVCGIPMIDYALAQCETAGLAPVIVNAHHLADQIEAHAEGRYEVSREDTILGTGGGLRSVRAALATPTVVVNADVLNTVDLRKLADGVPEGGACLAVRPAAPQEIDAYGAVTIDHNGQLCTLSTLGSRPDLTPEDPNTHFTGIHALDPSLLDDLPDGFSCIVRQGYAPKLTSGRLRGLRHEGTWLDVGNPAAYLTANLAALTTTVPLALDPFRFARWARGPRGEQGKPISGVEVQGSLWVGHEVDFGTRVKLRNTVIGHSARIDSNTELVRCVVWDGCHVPQGSWRDTIFYDGGVLTVH